MKVIKPIGGEQWFDLDIFDNRLNNFENSGCTFTSGGQSSMNFIVGQLRMKDDEFMLLPAYLCPTIVWNLQRNRVNFDFYRINRDLTIDIPDLEKKLLEHKVRAVFFIDYFGFCHDRGTLGCLKALKEKGIAIVEDAVQMLWFSRQEFIGDYVFNSYRKFLPADGSLVISEAQGHFEGSEDEYYEHQNTARMKLTAFVKYGLGSMEDFVSLFAKAEEAYGKDTAVKGMADISRHLLNKVDAEHIGNVRRRNYEYLWDTLSGSVDIRPLLGKDLLGQNIPIGFPVLIENRDSIKKALRGRSIYCPAHWPILEEEWVQGFSDSIYLSERILTLPIDQRYDKEDLDRLVRELRALCKQNWR
jgi:hypothetical protein